MKHFTSVGFWKYHLGLFHVQQEQWPK